MIYIFFLIGSKRHDVICAICLFRFHFFITYICRNILLLLLFYRYRISVMTIHYNISPLTPPLSIMIDFIWRRKILTIIIIPLRYECNNIITIIVFC